MLWWKMCRMTPLQWQKQGETVESETRNTLKQRQREIGDRRQVVAHSLFIMEKNVAFFIGITMLNTDGHFSQMTVGATVTRVP